MIETGPRNEPITSVTLLEALRAGAQSSVYIDELGPGCFVIDGKFDLEASARIICENIRAPLV